MPKKIKIRFDELQSSALFAGVSPKTLKKIAMFPVVKELPIGYTIIKKDDIGDFLIIVLSGQVEVIDDTDDSEEVLNVLNVGAFAGEGSLVSGAPRSATIRAKTPVKIAYFNKEAYTKMVTTDPMISATLIRVHRQRCKDTIKKYGTQKTRNLLIMAGLAGLAALQGTTSMIPHLNDLIVHLPPATIAVVAPGALALILKLQKNDVNSLAGKVDKL
jgi:hypothetical protein